MDCPQNLYWDTTVTIGASGAVCGSVVVDPSFQSLNCTAPSGFGNTTLTVNVSGLVTAAVFEYDPPSITHVGPSPIDAMSTSTVVQVCVALELVVIPHHAAICVPDHGSQLWLVSAPCAGCVHRTQHMPIRAPSEHDVHAVHCVIFHDWSNDCERVTGRAVQSGRAVHR